MKYICVDGADHVVGQNAKGHNQHISREMYGEKWYLMKKHVDKPVSLYDSFEIAETWFWINEDEVRTLPYHKSFHSDEAMFDLIKNFFNQPITWWSYHWRKNLVDFTDTGCVWVLKPGEDYREVLSDKIKIGVYLEDKTIIGSYSHNGWEMSSKWAYPHNPSKDGGIKDSLISSLRSSLDKTQDDEERQWYDSNRYSDREPFENIKTCFIGYEPYGNQDPDKITIAYRVDDGEFITKL